MSTLTVPKTRPANARLRSSTPGAAGITDRAAFLRLPLKRRRQLLKAQAIAARGHYAQDTAWREWEAADLTRA